MTWRCDHNSIANLDKDACLVCHIAELEAECEWLVKDQQHYMTRCSEYRKSVTHLSGELERFVHECERQRERIMELENAVEQIYALLASLVSHGSWKREARGSE